MSNKIFSDTIDFLKEVDNITISLIELIFCKIKDKINEELGQLSHDMIINNEEMVVYYSTLKKNYINILDGSSLLLKLIKPDKNKNVLGEIYSVLKSQLIYMDEGNLANQLLLKIKYEIKNHIDMFGMNFELEKTYFLDIKTEELLKFGRKVNTDKSSMVKFLKEDIENNSIFYFENIYMYYNEALEKSILSILDLIDFNKRILKKQRNTVAKLILKYSPNLQKCMKGNGFSKKEEVILSKLIDSLKDSYYLLNENIISLERKNNKISKVNLIKSFEDFCIEINEDILKEIDDAILTKSNNILSELKRRTLEYSVERINTSIEDLNIKKKIYESKKNVSNHKIFANDIVDIFNSLDSYYIKHKDYLELSNKNKIINGIAETISIKIESIIENANEFYKESKDILDEIKVNNITYGEALESKEFIDGVDNILNEVLSFYNLKDFEVNKIDILFLNFVNQYLSKINNKIENILSRVQKNIISFLKNIILFEISTFEEVYNYSVSLLKDETDTTVMQYVNLIDYEAINIQNLLVKNDISLISPTEHESFNAIEHEILLVEKNELFKKGEIIRVVNRGYKYNDIVIIRANVIAAK